MNFSLATTSCFADLPSCSNFLSPLFPGWIYTFMGIAVAPAVFPIFSCITLSNANGTGERASFPRLSFLTRILIFLFCSLFSF